MISICRACSHMVCRHRIDPSRLTHSSFVRLLGIGLRVIRAVPSSSSFIRYGAAGRSRGHHPAGGILGVSRACGFAFIFSPIRYGRRGDDVLVVSIYGRYRWRTGGGSCPGVFCFRCGSILVRLCRSVLPLRSSDTRNGTGACLSPLVPLSSLVAVIDGVADGDGVPVDGV